MSEFRIHHDVNELLSLLRVHGGDGAEVYIELLQKNRTPYVTTTVSAHSAKVKIAEFSRTPEDFLKKYDELKSKSTRNLDSLVYLLSKLTEDRQTLQYLQQNAKERAESAAAATASSIPGFGTPPMASRISMQELEELRKQLGSVAAGSTLQQSLELTRKMLRDKQNKKNSGQQLPVFPAWVYERPTLLGDFLTGSGPSTDTTVPIGMCRISPGNEGCFWASAASDCPLVWRPQCPLLSGASAILVFISVTLEAVESSGWQPGSL